MNSKSFQNNIRLEVAVEVMASKIADAINKGLSTEDEELKILVEEREKMYSGDKETIDKILNVYGPEIKDIYNERKNLKDEKTGFER